MDGKVWKLKGYINTSEYGKWLKITLRDPDEQQSAPSFIPKEDIRQDLPDDKDIPF